MNIRKVKRGAQFNPKCLHGRDLAYSVTGHMTPCCWLNVSSSETWIKDFFSDELHIDNFNSVAEILETKTWVDFFEMLKNEPKRAPLQCKRMCSRPLNEDPEIE